MMLTVGHVSNLINSPFAVCALHVFTLLLSTRMLRSDTPLLISAMTDP